MSAQKLGHLRPVVAAFPRAFMYARANLQYILGQPNTFLGLKQPIYCGTTLHGNRFQQQTDRCSDAVSDERQIDMVHL